MAVIELRDDVKLDAAPKVRELGAMDALDRADKTGGMEGAGRAVGAFLNEQLPDNGVARDIALSIATAIPKGITGFYGLPASLLNFVQQPGEDMDYLGDSRTDLNRISRIPLEARDIQGFLENRATGPWYQPQTGPGRVFDQATQFATQGGLMGGFRGLLSGAAGGATQEIAGQIPGIAGTPYEAPVRFGSGLAATAMTNALLFPRSNAGAVLGSRLEGTTQEELNAARERMAEAQRIDQAARDKGILAPGQTGVSLNVAEAMDNKPLAAVASANAQVRPGIGRMVDQRGENAPAVIRGVIAPDMASAGPEMRAAGARAAKSDLSDRARAAGYAAAEPQTLDRAVMQPLIREVANAWLSAPVEARAPIARLYQNLVNSGGNVRAVHDAWEIAKKSIAPAVGPLAPEATAAHNALVDAIGRGSSGGGPSIVDMMRDALRSNPDYRKALDMVTREAKSAEMMGAVDKSLEKVRPVAGQPNPAPGVAVRNDLIGNEIGTAQAKQTESTIREAATRMGANPDLAWEGAQKAIDILGRQQRVPGAGSPTHGRGQIAGEASRTGLLGTATDLNVTQPLSFINRVLANTYFRGAHRDLERLFTNPSPEAVDIMMRMARMNDTSATLLVPSLIATTQRETQTP